MKEIKNLKGIIVSKNVNRENLIYLNKIMLFLMEIK
jgi:hypothetical protein